MDEAVLKGNRNMYYMPLKQNDRTKAKRRRLNPSHRWSEAQRLELLHAVDEQVKDSIESFEKPTAQKFYEKIGQNSLHLKDINWSIMKSKMRHIKTTYVSALNWKTNKGARLMANGEANTAANYVNRICQNFDLVDRIFGQKQNIDPLVIFENSYQSQDFLMEPNESTTNPPSPKPYSTQSEQSESDTTELKPNLRLQKKQKPKKNYSNKFSLLLSLQESRLQLEAKKFELQKDTAQKELELKRMQLGQEFELKKLEIERNERFQKYDLELKRLQLDQEFQLKKLEIERNERVQKFELELKFKSES